MTTFGGDVSAHPSSLSAYKAAGGQFLIARCVTEPCTADPAYAPTVADAEAAGLLAGGYDFLTGDFGTNTVEHRAELFIATLGSPANRIAMLDVERPSYPVLHPPPQAADVKRWMAVWRAHYPTHPVLLYLPRWYYAGWPSVDLSTVGPLVQSDYRNGWTSFAAYTAGGGAYSSFWTTGYAGFSGPSLWQFEGSSSTYGFGADLTAYQGTLAGLRALALGAPGGDMNAVSTPTPLGSPAPRNFTIPAGATVNGYSVSKPNQVVKTSTWATATTAHASATVAVDWYLPDGTPAGTASPTPRGYPFLAVVDGFYAGLLIVAAQVKLDPADPVYTAADLRTQYNAGVTAASAAALSASKP